ncbi:hypothetical protein [Corynebacterium phocae]|uniref:hypothetical protein n=1 Tax=Corynebacterium phocae TaxID=161895 RepID=UPI000950D7EF|nr:hypothetical protein [Corynebacterium phocae]KAA8721920.1 hypothetical protein F4V58_09595 [Corynebacterium phocae]
MGKHREEPTTAISAEHLAPLIEDDAFLTELSRGHDPSNGEDPLAQLFLELREEVEAPMPPAPLVVDAEQEGQEPAAGAAPVFSINVAGRRTHRGLSPLVSGLVGVAAGVVLVAGAGAVVNSAGPQSPLYPVRNAVFGSDDHRVVELASTLEELEDRTAKGDIDGARKLISQARKQLSAATPRDIARLQQAEETVTQLRTTTTTVTVTVTAGQLPPSASAPAPQPQNPAVEIPAPTLNFAPEQLSEPPVPAPEPPAPAAPESTVPEVSAPEPPASGVVPSVVETLVGAAVGSGTEYAATPQTVPSSPVAVAPAPASVPAATSPGEQD